MNVDLELETESIWYLQVFSIDRI